MILEEAEAGGILFQRGDAIPDWIYLLEGEVALEADDILMERIQGGSDAAIFPLAHQIPRKVTARALTRVCYVRIDQQKLKRMEQYQEKIHQEAAGEKVKNAADWMTELFKSPVFQQLPASNLQKILQRLQKMEVAAGTRLIIQGQPADCLYILHSGKCQVTRKPRPNASREIRLGEFHTGSMFGEDALISGQARAANVTMLSEGVVLRLEKEDFLSLVVEPVLSRVSFESAIREVEEGSVWLDVRDPDRYRRRHIRGSLNLPFFFLRKQLNTLQRRRRYITVSESGNLGAAAAFLLLRYGFEAAVLEGGFTSVPLKYLNGEETTNEGDVPPPDDVHPLVLQDLRMETDSLEDRESSANLQDTVQQLEADLRILREENHSLQVQIREMTATQMSMAAGRETSGKIEKLCQEKQALEDEAATLRHRVEELESVIRQYCEAAQAQGVEETIQALEKELEMVRNQADADVSAMRRQVEEARRECSRLTAMFRTGAEDGEKNALPANLVAVDPAQLPLQPALPESASAEHGRPGQTGAWLWVLVGILASFALLGMGIQTDVGKRWVVGWLQEGAGPQPMNKAGAPSSFDSSAVQVDGDLFATDEEMGIAPLKEPPSEPREDEMLQPAEANDPMVQ